MTGSSVIRAVLYTAPKLLIPVEDVYGLAMWCGLDPFAVAPAIDLLRSEKQCTVAPRNIALTETGRYRAVIEESSLLELARAGWKEREVEAP